MKDREVGILAALYVAKLTGQNPRSVLERRRIAYDEAVLDIGELVKEGMIGPDRETITDKGAGSLKIVLAGGVFDIIHPGHIHTLREAKKLGDVLIVVIATDGTAIKMKKKRPLHGQRQRRMLVDSLEIVDAAVNGNDSDIFRTVEAIRPSIIALGYDQIHQEKSIIDGCKRINLGVTVARLQSPIPGLSSSAIEKEYGGEIHGI